MLFDYIDKNFRKDNLVYGDRKEVSRCFGLGCRIGIYREREWRGISGWKCLRLEMIVVVVI